MKLKVVRSNPPYHQDLLIVDRKRFEKSAQCHFTDYTFDGDGFFEEEIEVPWQLVKIWLKNRRANRIAEAAINTIFRTAMMKVTK